MTPNSHLLLAGLAALGLAAPAGADIGQPLNAGEKIIYAVTGVLNDPDDDDQLATVFACTNLGDTNVTYILQVFNASGSQVGAGSTTLSPGETDAFETQSVSTVSAINIAAGSIYDGGSARIIISGVKKPKVICNAHVVDPDATEATASMMLPVFPTGKPPKVKAPKP